LFIELQRRFILALEDVMSDVHTALRTIITHLEKNEPKPALEEPKKNGDDAPRRGRPPKSAPPTTAIPIEVVREAAGKVLAEKGRPVINKLITEVGECNKIIEMDPTKYAAFIAACDIALSVRPAPATEEDDETL
jgi:hypothetical protein